MKPLGRRLVRKALRRGFGRAMRKGGAVMDPMMVEQWSEGVTDALCTRETLNHYQNVVIPGLVEALRRIADADVKAEPHFFPDSVALSFQNIARAALAQM